MAISADVSPNNKRKHEDDATSSKRQRRVPDIIAFCEKQTEWMPIKLDIVPKQNEMAPRWKMANQKG